ncbi:thermonuclease family protein [Mesorhizobium sp. 128a]
MRLLQLALAVLAIPAMVALVVAGGRVLQPEQRSVVIDQIDPGIDAVPGEPATSAIPETQPAKPAAPSPPVHSRAIDPEAIAPPPLPPEELERVEPRAPLSDLALAGPPRPRRPKAVDDWGGTKLFQPVASAAGLIDANGYSVAVSGIDIVKEDETCTDDGKSWACGVRARTAFRSFLRGRAVACKVPPEADSALIAAECRIGKQDVGQWLVENGWARAVSGGPYVEAGDKARDAKKGIFGAAPDLGGLPPAPTSVAAPTASQPILDAPATDTPPVGTEIMPPADQPEPAQ